MCSKLMLSLACILAMVANSTAQDKIFLLASDGFASLGGRDDADIGRNRGDSASLDAGGCQVTWTRANTERVDCTYRLPNLPATVPGGGSAFTVQASTETNGIFDGVVSPGCSGLLVNAATNVGNPSLTDALRLDCTGTVGGRSDDRPLCFDGTAALKRC